MLLKVEIRYYNNQAKYLKAIIYFNNFLNFVRSIENIVLYIKRRKVFFLFLLLLDYRFRSLDHLYTHVAD